MIVTLQRFPLWSIPKGALADSTSHKTGLEEQANLATPDLDSNSEIDQDLELSESNGDAMPQQSAKSLEQLTHDGQQPHNESQTQDEELPKHKKQTLDLEQTGDVLPKDLKQSLEHNVSSEPVLPFSKNNQSNKLAVEKEEQSEQLDPIDLASPFVLDSQENLSSPITKPEADSQEALKRYEYQEHQDLQDQQTNPTSQKQQSLKESNLDPVVQTDRVRPSLTSQSLETVLPVESLEGEYKHSPDSEVNTKTKLAVESDGAESEKVQTVESVKKEQAVEGAGTKVLESIKPVKAFKDVEPIEPVEHSKSVESDTESGEATVPAKSESESTESVDTELQPLNPLSQVGTHKLKPAINALLSQSGRGRAIQPDPFIFGGRRVKPVEQTDITSSKTEGESQPKTNTAAHTSLKTEEKAQTSKDSKANKHSVELADTDVLQAGQSDQSGSEIPLSVSKTEDKSQPQANAVDHTSVKTEAKVQTSKDSNADKHSVELADEDVLQSGKSGSDTPVSVSKTEDKVKPQTNTADHTSLKTESKTQTSKDSNTAKHSVELADTDVILPDDEYSVIESKGSDSSSSSKAKPNGDTENTTNIKITNGQNTGSSISNGISAGISTEINAASGTGNESVHSISGTGEESLVSESSQEAGLDAGAAKSVQTSVVDTDMFADIDTKTAVGTSAHNTALSNTAAIPANIEDDDVKLSVGAGADADDSLFSTSATTNASKDATKNASTGADTTVAQEKVISTLEHLPLVSDKAQDNVESEGMFEDDPLADLKLAAARSKNAKAKLGNSSKNESDTTTAELELSKDAQLAALKQAVANAKAEEAAEVAKAKGSSHDDDPLAALQRALSDPKGLSLASQQASISASEALKAERSKNEMYNEDPVAALKNVLSDIKQDFDKAQDQRSLQSNSPVYNRKQLLSNGKAKSAPNVQAQTASLDLSKNNTLGGVEKAESEQSNLKHSHLEQLKRAMQSAEDVANGGIKAGENASNTANAINAADAGNTANAANALNAADTSKIKLHTTAARNLAHTYGAYAEQARRQAANNRLQAKPAANGQSTLTVPDRVGAQPEVLAQSPVSSIASDRQYNQDAPDSLANIQELENSLEQALSNLGDTNTESSQGGYLAGAVPQTKTQAENDADKAKMQSTKMQVMAKLMQNTRQSGLTDSFKQEIASRVMSQAPNISARAPMANKEPLTDLNSLSQGAVELKNTSQGSRANESSTPISVADMAAAIDENERQIKAAKARAKEQEEGWGVGVTGFGGLDNGLSRGAGGSRARIGSRGTGSGNVDSDAAHVQTSGEIISNQFRSTMEHFRRQYHLPAEMARGFDMFQNQGNRYQIFHHATLRSAKQINAMQFSQKANTSEQSSKFKLDPNGVLHSND